jgi:hypothetical protein
MTDNTRKIAIAVMKPGQPIRVDTISQKNYQPSLIDQSPDQSTAFLPNNQGDGEFFISPNNKHFLKSYNKSQTDIAREISQSYSNISHSPVSNSKEFVINLISSIPDEIFTPILQTILLLLITRGNGFPTFPTQPIFANNTDIKELLHSMLAVISQQYQPSNIYNNNELTNNVRTLWNEIVDHNQYVVNKSYLTKKLQKKLNSTMIQEALDFMVAEDGVMEKIEQEKRPNGGAPLIQYQLLQVNPKYFDSNGLMKKI